MRAFFLLLLGLAACDGAAPAGAPPERDAQDRPDFVDAAGLADGTVVREDAAPPLPDAAVFTDGGVCRTGDVRGVVCAPDQSTIAGAEVVAVTRDCFGEPSTVRVATAGNGFFRLSGLAPGRTDVTIRAGNFLGLYSVEVIAGASVLLSGEVSPKVCLKSTDTDLAILTGDYDRIQEIVGDLGFELELLCGGTGYSRPGRALLQDWEALRQRDVVFINCASGIDLRATNPETQLIIENLRRFVAEGKSVYVSDLSADFIESIWPEFVEFDFTAGRAHEEDACCVCGSDCARACVVDPPREAETCPNCCTAADDAPDVCDGPPPISGRGIAQVVPALVLDEDMQAYLASPEIDIRFAVGGWVEIRDVDADRVEVLVEGAPGGAHAGRPLMILFQPDGEDGGRVAYTSFHNHDQASADMRAILAALIFRL